MQINCYTVYFVLSRGDPPEPSSHVRTARPQIPAACGAPPPSLCLRQPGQLVVRPQVQRLPHR